MDALKKTLIKIFCPENYTCSFCDREVFDGKPVCEDCLKTLPFNDGFICGRCGRATKSPTEYCDDCKRSRIYFDGARSAYIYAPPVSGAIKALKFSGKKYFAREFAAVMAKVYYKAYFNCEVIVPVPSSPSRIKEKGYNQSELIAAALGELTDIPVINAVAKKRETESQVGLTEKERYSNLSGSFKVVDAEAIKGKKVLIVDDVMTTGTTLNVMAETLKKAGANEVYGITAACALRDD